ncbi:hypothetical protein [Microbacterium sp. GXF6406]
MRTHKSIGQRNAERAERKAKALADRAADAPARAEREAAAAEVLRKRGTEL